MVMRSVYLGVNPWELYWPLTDVEGVIRANQGRNATSGRVKCEALTGGSEVVLEFHYIPYFQEILLADTR
jgi:hypothetical protein